MTLPLGEKTLSPQPVPLGGSRMVYIDNLRLCMIMMVVLVHLNVTYGQIGSWYYVEHRSLDTISTILFAAFGSFTQAYFMGILFFIAGYFTPRSYDRKGAWSFVADRLIRLGVPTLVYMFLLNPIVGLIQSAYLGEAPEHLGWAYMRYLSSLEFLGGSGPLWFALALLIFSLVYAGIRIVMAGRQSKAITIRSITHTSLIGSILALSLVTFIVRLAQPIGTAVYNMQLCFFPQYVFLFVLGVVAYRSRLLDWLPSRLGAIWLKIAVFVGVPAWIIVLLLGGALDNIQPYYGGWYWQALAYAAWESFFCIGFGLGLIVWFREHGNRQNRLSAFLSSNAFGVYVFHAPILVSVTLALRGLVLHPIIKMGLAALIVFPLCFAVSYGVRAVPALRKLFS